MNFEVSTLVRKNIAAYIERQKNTTSYQAKIRFDDNANLFGSPLANDYHRHDEALSLQTLTTISDIKRIPLPNIALASSNYQVIQHLLQVFCEPKTDNIIVCPPTMPVFEQAAMLHGTPIKRVFLDDNFQLDIEGIAEAIDDNTKIIFLASPNDPTGNALHREDIEVILHNFQGIVVIDETYINYARSRSFWYEIKEFPNLVILQNFDKAWGLATLQLATIFASTTVIDLLENIIPAPTVSAAALEKFLQATQQIDLVNQWTKDTVLLRNHLANALSTLPIVEKVYPSDSNFLLVKFRPENKKLEAYLKANDIVLKNMHLTFLCENTFRITVNNIQNNSLLINVLSKFE